MGFEVYEKGSAPAPTVPSVTIQKRGLFSLNRAAYEMASSPEAVELLWDAERRAIALRPAAADNPNAYPVRAQNNLERGPFLVAGTLFTQFVGLDTSDAYRWVPTLEDNLLVIDVSQPGHRATVGRGRSSSKTVAAEEISSAAT